MNTPTETTAAKIQRVPSGICGYTWRLIELLRGTDKEELTDAELTAACGRGTAVGQDGYGNLRTAMNYILRNDGKHWKRLAGAGCIRLLSGDQTADDCITDRNHIRRTARKAVTKTQTIRLEDIPEARRPYVLSLGAQMGFLAQMSRTETTKRLEAAKVQKPLELNKLLEQFPHE